MGICAVLTELEMTNKLEETAASEDPCWTAAELGPAMEDTDPEDVDVVGSRSGLPVGGPIDPPGETTVGLAPAAGDVNPPYLQSGPSGIDGP